MPKNAIMPVKLYFFSLNFAVPEYAVFPFIYEDREAPGINCVISSRAAGNMVYSPKNTNPVREQFFCSLGLESAKVFACTQVHSRRAVEAGSLFPNSGPEADGLVSRDAAVTLSVTIADCLPVFLYDTNTAGTSAGAGTSTGAMGLVHSGWKGTGIVLRALELMAELWRSRPEVVAAVLGPCISVCCYKVDAERAAFFEKEFGGTFPGLEAAAGVEASGLEAAASAYLGPVSRCEETKDGLVWRLDLKAANVRLLAGAGVLNIAVCEDCTFTDDRLGSFRREGPQNGSYTRMLALAGYF